MIFRIITQLCSRFQYTLTRININVDSTPKIAFFIAIAGQFYKIADQKTLI